MPKKLGAIFVALGAVLILSALLLFLHNKQEDRRAGQEAETLLTQLRSVMESRQAETQPTQSTAPTAETTAEEETQPTTTEPTESTGPLDPEMPRVWMDGVDYIGYLTIPDLELELPVIADWTYERLQTAPCRQFGSSRTDDLVIAAHNYESHFGTLKNLELGARITFTDMEQIVNHYVLVKLENIDPTNIDAVQYSGHDLVLYTCTPGGALRVAAFFDRDTDPEA